MIGISFLEKERQRGLANNFGEGQKEEGNKNIRKTGI